MSQFIVSLMISQAILDLDNTSKIVTAENNYNNNITPWYERIVQKPANTSYPKRIKDVKRGVVYQPRANNH